MIYFLYFYRSMLVGKRNEAVQNKTSFTSANHVTGTTERHPYSHGHDVVSITSNKAAEVRNSSQSNSICVGHTEVLVIVRKPGAPSRTGHHGDGSLVPANVSAGVAGSTVNAAGAISTRLQCPGAGSAGLLGPHSGAFKTLVSLIFGTPIELGGGW